MGSLFPRVRAKRNALYGDRLHVKDLQAETAQKFHERPHREIRGVFVVDGVKGQPVKHVLQIRGLKHKNTVVREKRCNALYNILQVINVRDDVVARNDLGRAVLLADALGDRCAEEFRKCRDAPFVRDLYDVHRRVNAKHPGT